MKTLFKTTVTILAFASLISCKNETKTTPVHRIPTQKRPR